LQNDNNIFDSAYADPVSSPKENKIKKNLTNLISTRKKKGKKSASPDKKRKAEVSAAANLEAAENTDAAAGIQSGLDNKQEEDYVTTAQPFYGLENDQPASAKKKKRSKKDGKRGSIVQDDKTRVHDTIEMEEQPDINLS